jgi:uncharacterized glyoxalase superfamily protein PhnB
MLAVMHARILVNIDVPELEPAIAFYEAAVGARVARLLDNDVAELTYGSSVLYLLCRPAGSKVTPRGDMVRARGRHWTPVHVDFVVDDIDTAVERALAAGAERETECVEWRGSKCVTFSDPFGHGSCLIELSGGGYE